MDAGRISGGLWHNLHLKEKKAWEGKRTVQEKVNSEQAFDKQQMKKSMQSTLRFILKNGQKLVWVFLKHNRVKSQFQVHYK